MTRTTLASVKLRNQLLTLDPTLTVALRNIRVNGALFGCSGFITGRNGRVVYVNTDTNHGLRVDCPLYRTARDTRDYTGGFNRFTSNDRLAVDVVELLNSNSEIWEDANAGAGKNRYVVTYYPRGNVAAEVIADSAEHAIALIAESNDVAPADLRAEIL